MSEAVLNLGGTLLCPTPLGICGHLVRGHQAIKSSAFPRPLLGLSITSRWSRLRALVRKDGTKLGGPLGLAGKQTWGSSCRKQFRLGVLGVCRKSGGALAAEAVHPAVQAATDLLNRIPPLLQVPPAVALLLFSIVGLEPWLRWVRQGVRKVRGLSERGEDGWHMSRTKMVALSYVRPMLLWMATVVICRALDTVVLAKGHTNLVKHRGVNFVRTFSTVLAFTFCLTSAMQQMQRAYLSSDTVDSSQKVGLQFVSSIVSGTIWLLAVCLSMELLGFSTQRWLTAGGIGTVLFTLAGKEIVTNFFSSVLIHATRPFMVGDLIETRVGFTEVTGFVEHIGWWSRTVVRSFERELITVPNHHFTTSVLRNVSRKTHWRFHEFLSISYLDADKIRPIVQDLRKLTAKHPRIEQKALHRRVFFDSINKETQSMDIIVSCYFTTKHPDEFAALKEELLFDMLQIVKYHKARLATPVRSFRRMEEDVQPKPPLYADPVATYNYDNASNLFLAEQSMYATPDPAPEPDLSTAPAQADDGLAAVRPPVTSNGAATGASPGPVPAVPGAAGQGQAATGAAVSGQAGPGVVTAGSPGAATTGVGGEPAPAQVVPGLVASSQAVPGGAAPGVAATGLHGAATAGVPGAATTGVLAAGEQQQQQLAAAAAAATAAAATAAAAVAAAAAAASKPPLQPPVVGGAPPSPRPPPAASPPPPKVPPSGDAPKTVDQQQPAAANQVSPGMSSRPEVVNPSSRPLECAVAKVSSGEGTARGGGGDGVGEKRPNLSRLDSLRLSGEDIALLGAAFDAPKRSDTAHEGALDPRMVPLQTNPRSHSNAGASTSSTSGSLNQDVLKGEVEKKGASLREAVGLASGSGQVARDSVPIAGRGEDAPT